jgi:hypothetical protein
VARLYKLLKSRGFPGPKPSAFLTVANNCCSTEEGWDFTVSAGSGIREEESGILEWGVHALRRYIMRTMDHAIPKRVRRFQFIEAGIGVVIIRGIVSRPDSMNLEGVLAR